MAEARVERRLAAILAADVAGYSRLMGTDEAGTLAALKAHRREIVDPAIAAHKGRIVKTTGDGMLVEFASAVDAVTCAVAVQEKMAERAAEGSGPRIQFRFGINIGDIIIDGDDIFGDGVNVAARVENECEPGGVCLSDDVYRQVRGKTAFTIDDLGEKSLKNIDRPMRLYAVRTAGAAKLSTETAAEPLSLPDKPSIAVLPFKNLSGDPDQDYFADGVVEEITVALSRFKSLFVISRNSSFSYRGKPVDARLIGNQLGVRYVLQGSVRRAGARIRISGQLIEAARDIHLWANTFDGDLENLFALHDDVARSVVGAIVPRVLEAEIERTRHKPVERWSAYDHYLRGMALLGQPSPSALDEAIRHFREALASESDFALALATLAACEVTRRFVFGQELSEADLADALEAAEHAARLAPDDDRSLAYCAVVFAFLTDNLERAVALAERAIDLNPNLALAWTVLGWANTWLGEIDRGRAAFDAAIRLNPLDSQALLQILPGYVVICFISDLREERLAWANRLLTLDPLNLTGLLAVLDVETLRQHRREAAAIEARLRAAYPGLSSTDVGQIFRRYRKPEHQAMFDDFLKRLPLFE
jgi:adenylate cyclase